MIKTDLIAIARNDMVAYEIGKAGIEADLF